MIGRAKEHGAAEKHSLAHIVIAPGDGCEPHYHKVCEESYYILKGRARLVLDGQSYEMAPGQACLLMPGQTHQIISVGEEDLEFLAVCAPAWYPEDTYRE